MTYEDKVYFKALTSCVDNVLQNYQDQSPEYQRTLQQLDEYLAIISEFLPEEHKHVAMDLDNLINDIIVQNSDMVTKIVARIKD